MLAHLRTSSLVVASVAAGGLVLSGCAGGTDSQTPAATLPVVVDTDVGPDDVVALLYLLRHPDVDVRAVTVAGTGLAHCDAGTARVLSVLALTGHDGVPVACGRDEPGPGGHPFPEDFRGYADAMPGLRLPAGGEADARTAVEVLAAAIGESDRPVQVVTLGPLTNLADLLESVPSVREDVAGVQVMGGAVAVPGNVAEAPVAEWNVYADPAAARAVLASGLPITLVPLDATNDVPLTIHLLRSLASHHDAPPTAAWHDFLEANPFQYSGGQYLWDEATAVTLTDPGIATFEDIHLTVTVDGANAGWTPVSSTAPRIRVATALDRPGLETTLLSVLEGAPVELEPAHADAIVTVEGGAARLEATASDVGPVVVDIHNTTDVTTTVVIGRLLDGATEADLRAVETFEAPSWFAGESLTTVLPGDTTTVVVDLTAPGAHWVAAGTTADDPPMIAGAFTLGS